MPIRPPAPPPPLRSATRHALEYARRCAGERVCASAPPPPSAPARGLNLTTAYNSGRTNGHGATGATAATSLVSNSPFHTSLLPPKLPSRRLPPPSTCSESCTRRDPKQLSVLGPCAKLTANAVQLLAFRSMCERMSGNGAPAVARRSPNPPPPHTTHDACTTSESPHRRPHTPGGPFHLGSLFR